jgi:Xaa-Pro dipeptidase
MEGYLLTPAEEVHARISGLRGKIRDAGIDAAVVVQNADLFYFAGSIQQGMLVVPADGDPVYFVRRVHERAAEESPLGQILKIRGPKDVSDHFAGKGIAFGKVGFELDVLPVAAFERFRQVFPGAQVEDVSPMIREIRAVKSRTRPPPSGPAEGSSPPFFPGRGKGSGRELRKWRCRPSFSPRRSPPDTPE